MKRTIHLFLTLSMGILVSCDKSSDFQVLNYSDADWESVDPFEAQKLVMTDLKLLLKKHQENPDIYLPEDEMQTFHERLLQNFQFFYPSGFQFSSHHLGQRADTGLINVGHLQLRRV